MSIRKKTSKNSGFDVRNIEVKSMKIGYLFPVAIIIVGVTLLVWFIASGAYVPGG